MLSPRSLATPLALGVALAVAGVAACSAIDPNPPDPHVNDPDPLKTDPPDGDSPDTSAAETGP